MNPRILLIQARDASDAMLRHELECFAQQCALDVDGFTTLNLTVDSAQNIQLADFDAVMVGGSGDYSLATGGFDWHEPFLDLMRRVVRQDVPTFASCFGFQALVQALGGEVIKDPAAAEVGSFQITLTEEGLKDPLFGKLPKTFIAQLGHNDSVRNLPPTLVRIAFSDRCETHAVRVRSSNVVATQFHPELTMNDNITRYLRYLRAYHDGLDDAEAMKLAEEIHAPSADCNALLRHFVARLTPSR